ncbi:Beta-microseminoprotein, partial [Colius striatus]
CLDSDAKLYEFDSQWKTDNCYDCSCSRNGIRCCTSFMKSTGYDKKKCVSIFNKMTCTYKAVEKDNNSKECPVFDWVG